jgi:O-antigen/teichoic acid export membrane protein
MTNPQDGQLKKTVTHSAIYAFGSILRRLTGLIMLPIYTRFLTPADYGVVELLGMAIEIASILIGLRISQAMFRYYILAGSDKEKNSIVSTVLFTVIGTSSIGAAILFFAAEPLANVVFGTNEYIFELQLFAFTLVTNAIVAVGLSYLRARQAPILFVAINITSLLIQVCMNIVFVVVFEMHVTGVVYSALISGAVIATGMTWYVLAKVGFHYSIATSIKLIKFVAPLIVASLGAFYVAYADKYFLRLFSSLGEVGLYSLAARMSFLLVAVYESFNMSWTADRFEVVKSGNAKETFDQVFRFISAIVLIIGAGIALFSNDFFRVMTSENFYSASYIVPLLVVSALTYIYTLYCNFGALYCEQTQIIAVASWIKVIVATIGYLAFIPLYGVYGAAGTLAFSGAIELFWVHSKSKVLYDMGLNMKPVIIMFIAAVLCVSFGFLLPEGGMFYFLIRLVIFFSLLAVVCILPIWSDNEKLMMSIMFNKALSKVNRH